MGLISPSTRLDEEEILEQSFVPSVILSELHQKGGGIPLTGSTLDEQPWKKQACRCLAGASGSGETDKVWWEPGRAPSLLQRFFWWLLKTYQNLAPAC